MENPFRWWIGGATEIYSILQHCDKIIQGIDFQISYPGFPHSPFNTKEIKRALPPKANVLSAIPEQYNTDQ